MHKQLLTEQRRQLIEYCQDINFGRITFQVSAGQPDFSRSWRTRRTVKISGAEQHSRPETDRHDFELRHEQVLLLGHLSELPDGATVTVEVKHGLPFLIDIEQDHQAA